MGRKARFQIEPGITLGHLADARLGDADQNDGLGMLDQPHARNDRIGRDTGDDMDGFAGIARRRHEIGGKKGPADRLAPLQNRGDGRAVPQGSERVGARYDIGRRKLFQKTGQEGFGLR